MNALDLSRNKIHSNKYPIINMSSWIKNQTANLYNVVSALIAAIESVSETASLKDKRMMQNIKNGRET